MDDKQTPVDELLTLIADVVIAMVVPMIVFALCLWAVFLHWSLIAVLLWPHMPMLNGIVGAMVFIASLDDLIPATRRAIEYMCTKKDRR